VWFGVVQCSVLWCGVVWCGVGFSANDVILLVRM
jgi:hypothetical protein